MSTLRTPPPGRRPFGAVTLAAPVAAVRPAGRAGPPEPGRWYGPRVVLPLLSIETLRAGLDRG